jgi:hypothetical protein
MCDTCSVITVNFRLLPPQVSCSDCTAATPSRCAVSVSYWSLQNFKCFTATEVFFGIKHPVFRKSSLSLLSGSNVDVLTRSNIDVSIELFCWPCIIAYQYSETNVMHFLFGILRIKCLYMFRALLAHPQEAPHKRHLVYCLRVLCKLAAPGAANLHNTHAIYQV